VVGRAGRDKIALLRSAGGPVDMQDGSGRESVVQDAAGGVGDVVGVVCEGPAGLGRGLLCQMSVDGRDSAPRSESRACRSHAVVPPRILDARYVQGR
jgi:hypothetical protein